MLVSVADKPCVAIEPLKYSSSESRNRGTASCPRMNIYRNSEENVFVVVLKTQRQMSLASHGASPIVTEKEAKQLLRSRRQDRDRPSKPGFPDEPMREYMHHLLRLEHRAEEQFLEHWLNPHCKPHCDRNVVHPV
ncbi:uncharacterized protein C17orf67 homolog isoform X2 [Artibeus jamaicensis]|uniref:uncharacterized protein C17orf67 homolog isoform X2 n=1 Tax=Artibeus jamaicensis TaxID=9417 RepID=UPI00235B0FE4|nr:uncharacterized protein C17orf67 homolog isoform X2 [Artibeus jamaicensis]XP_053511944.1 uncharacterized protein C17orf67 homolog isoform X2 [Artibeus jamaicensis]